MEKLAELASRAFSPYALQRYRQDAGLSQRDLAEYAGVSEATIGNYERGSTTPPPDRIALMAQALGRVPAALTLTPINGMKYQLVASRLGYPPIDFIDLRRGGRVPRPDGKEGGWSFRLIAPALSEVVEMYVSHESARAWHREAHALTESEAGE